MKCPECGASCWREEVDVGVGIISSPWVCSNCSWDEDQIYPMQPLDWESWLTESNEQIEHEESSK